MQQSTTDLTDRQQRELDYHVGHARERQHVLDTPFSWEVIQNPARRWWNAYWDLIMFTRQN
jgi:hypothetical protein